MQQKNWVGLLLLVIVPSLLSGTAVWLWQQSQLKIQASSPTVVETPNANTPVAAKNCTGWCFNSDNNIQYVPHVTYAERELSQAEERECAIQGWCQTVSYMLSGEVVSINNETKTVAVLLNPLSKTDVNDPVQYAMPAARSSYTVVLDVPEKYIENGTVTLKEGQTIRVSHEYLLKKKFKGVKDFTLILNEEKQMEEPITAVFEDNKVIYNNEVYTLEPLDKTQVIDVPQERMTRNMKDALLSTNSQNVWYGLMPSLSEVINNGETVKIEGSIDSIGKRIIPQTVEILEARSH